MAASNEAEFCANNCPNVCIASFKKKKKQPTTAKIKRP